MRCRARRLARRTTLFAETGKVLPGDEHGHVHRRAARRRRRRRRGTRRRRGARGNLTEATPERDAHSNEPRVFRSHERGVAEEREDAAYALKRERETRRGGPGPTALDPTCFGADGDGARGGRNVAGGGRNVRVPRRPTTAPEERAPSSSARPWGAFLLQHRTSTVMRSANLAPTPKNAALRDRDRDRDRDPAGLAAGETQKTAPRSPSPSARAATRVAPNAHPTDDRTSAKSPSVTRRCFGDSSIDRVGGYAFVSV